MGKNLTVILTGVAVLGLIVLGYFLWSKPKPAPLETSGGERANESARKALESATNVTLPEIKPINPLEKLPDINPVEKANPFKDLYKNPFAR